MSKIISFDRVAEAKNILKNGIGETSNSARKDMNTVAWYLVNKTTYTKTQIENRLRMVADKYFDGMSEDYIQDCIKEIILYAKKEQVNENNYEVPQSIIIYKEELERIQTLKHDDTERLAFIFLCIAKMIPYKQIYECNSKLYQLAWRYGYDSSIKKVLGIQTQRRVGGLIPTKRVSRLCDEGFVKYATRINSAHGKSKNKPTAESVFTVLFAMEKGEVAFEIVKPDEDSLVLYYDRYKGYDGIISCIKCGKPVLRTGRRQKYCSVCADIINHHPEKRDL